ncbi:MAG: AmmeMemoRadiSam system protein B [Actinomycetota bacterium]|nr:AmmeMemoRadiSam system protein B [Actinomycetota bacterium]
MGAAADACTPHASAAVTAGQIRHAAVAGSFYPSDPEKLRAVVEDALRAAAGSADSAAPAPKAIVAPHAGYVYSGPVAASAYARLAPLRGRIKRAVVLGPAHRTPLTAVGASSADAFETPLGLLPVDTALRDELLGAGLVVVADEDHAQEHSVEVQLPFLQVTLGDVRVLPLVVGDVPASAVAAVIQAAWDRPATVVLVSTDLSHHHDHRTAQQLDRRTAQAVVGKQPEAIHPDDACGVFPLRGLLLAARNRPLDVGLLDLRTSADTGGRDDRVVGYGAFVLHAPAGEEP